MAPPPPRPSTPHPDWGRAYGYVVRLSSDTRRALHRDPEIIAALLRGAGAGDEAARQLVERYTRADARGGDEDWRSEPLPELLAGQRMRVRPVAPSAATVLLDWSPPPSSVVVVEVPVPVSAPSPSVASGPTSPTTSSSASSRVRSPSRANTLPTTTAEPRGRRWCWCWCGA